jgi:hypothetical protein
MRIAELLNNLATPAASSAAEPPGRAPPGFGAMLSGMGQAAQPPLAPANDGGRAGGEALKALSDITEKALSELPEDQAGPALEAVISGVAGALDGAGLDVPGGLEQAFQRLAELPEPEVEQALAPLAGIAEALPPRAAVPLVVAMNAVRQQLAAPPSAPTRPETGVATEPGSLVPAGPLPPAPPASADGTLGRPALSVGMPDNPGATSARTMPAETPPVPPANANATQRVFDAGQGERLQPPVPRDPAMSRLAAVQPPDAPRPDGNVAPQASAATVAGATRAVAVEAQLVGAQPAQRDPAVPQMAASTAPGSVTGADKIKLPEPLLPTHAPSVPREGAGPAGAAGPAILRPGVAAAEVPAQAVANAPGEIAAQPAPVTPAPPAMEAMAQPAPAPAAPAPPAVQAMAEPAAQATAAAHGAPAEGTGDEVLAQLRRVRITEGRTRIELSPASLGRLEVELSADEAGLMRVVVRAENPATLAMLRGDRQGLAELLTGQGFELDDSQMEFQEFGDDSPQQPPTAIPDLVGTGAEDEAPMPTPASLPSYAPRLPPGRVDILT